MIDTHNAEQLRLAMAKANLRGVHLAELAGTTSASISRVVNGERPGPELAHKINTALGSRIYPQADNYNPETGEVTPTFREGGKGSRLLKEKKNMLLRGTIEDSPEDMVKEIIELDKAIAKMKLRKAYLAGMLELTKADNA